MFFSPGEMGDKQLYTHNQCMEPFFSCGQNNTIVKWHTIQLRTQQRHNSSFQIFVLVINTPHRQQNKSRTHGLKTGFFVPSIWAQKLGLSSSFLLSQKIQNKPLEILSCAFNFQLQDHFLIFNLLNSKRTHGTATLGECFSWAMYSAAGFTGWTCPNQ